MAKRRKSPRVGSNQTIKGNMKDMTECHKCFEVALGYLENASDPEVWHDMTDVYTRHGAIHSSAKVLTHLLSYHH